MTNIIAQKNVGDTTYEHVEIDGERGICWLAGDGYPYFVDLTGNFYKKIEDAQNAYCHDRAVYCSFDDEERAKECLEGLREDLCAPSLGGVEYRNGRFQVRLD